MEAITRIETMRARVAAWRGRKQRVALVPTMGNLHKGHLSLIAQAQQHADKVVVSAFVNPMQFGPKEDFDKYPRTPDEDMETLRTVSADVMFAPGVLEIYPLGHQRSTVVEVPELSGILCGAFRPGHFAGVATVITKLLNIVSPDCAVFGEKDYQQLVIVKRIVADLLLPVDILAAPIVRDEDGLALSSRNRYLAPEDRAIAPKLYRTLQAAQRQIEDGDTDFAALQQTGMHALELAGFKPEYFAVRQAGDLQPIRSSSRELVILAAVRLGATRLIDNVKVTLPGQGQ